VGGSSPPPDSRWCHGGEGHRPRSAHHGRVSGSDLVEPDLLVSRETAGGHPTLGRASAGRATPATGAVHRVGRCGSAPCEMGAAGENVFHVKRMPRWRAASTVTLGQLVETEGAGGGGVKGMAPQIRDLSVRQPRLPHRARRPSSWRRCSPLPDPFVGLFHVKPDSGIGRAGGAGFGPLSDLAPPKLIASRWSGPNTDEEWIRSL
jgi:hypothetical protein